MLPRPPVSGRPARLIMLLSSVALLSACGGGGGSATNYSAYLPNFAAPAPVLVSVLTAGFGGINSGTSAAANTLLGTARYLNTPATLQWLRDNFDPNISGQVYAAKSSGIAFAHAAGLTGAGQLVAVSDDRISVGHDVFAGKTVTVVSNDTTGEHGTSVASVALGNSSDFVGTAPGADLLFGTFLTDQTLTALGQQALAMAAVAWNNSWSYPGLSANQAGFNAAFSGSSGAAYLTALDNYAAQGVVVFAVSNDETRTRSGIMDGLPDLRHSLEAGWLAVANGVPTFIGGTVSAVNLLSSPCWEAARWCLVADGSWNAATGPGSDYDFITGSSFAAPQVAGALALLAEAFPGLAPHQLRIRLLASAENDFFTPDAAVELANGVFKGYSVIYGHGFLDIEAALRPIGGTTLGLQEGTRISTDAPVLMTGSGFGDAVERSLAGTNVAVKDALDAGFAMPGEALAAGAVPGDQAGALLAKSLRTNLAADRKAAPGALTDPFASFSGPVLTMTAPDGSASASVLVPEGGAGGLGVTVTRVLTDGATKLELGLKLARDNGQILSLGGKNAASMASVTLGLTQDLGGSAFLALSGEMGLTDLGGATALTAATTARFDALKLTIGQSDVLAKGDRISIGVGTPMAIASGTTVVDLPVYRQGAAMSFETVELGLAPADRQLDLEMTYQAALSDRVEMKLSLVHSENFGNRAGVSDTAGAIAFAFRF